MSVKKPMNIKEKLKILGIEGKATLEDVKKAYKKLAIEFHPDKNNGKDDKMKMINSVYAEVVNFFENKKNYEVKESFHEDDQKSDDGFGGDESKPDNNAKWVVRISTLIVQISKPESILGVIKNISVPIVYHCYACENNKCGVCLGYGFHMDYSSHMPAKIECRACNGIGYKVSRNCNSCKGEGEKKSTTIIVVRIPPNRKNFDSFMVKVPPEFNSYNSRVKISIMISENPDFSGEFIESPKDFRSNHPNKQTVNSAAEIQDKEYSKNSGRGWRLTDDNLVMEISHQESIKGTIKNVAIPTERDCELCRSTPCYICKRENKNCLRCNGKGYNPKVECKICSGIGVETSHINVSVKLSPGCRDGMEIKINIPKEVESKRNDRIKVMIKIIDDEKDRAWKNCEKIGKDIHMRCKIPLKTYILGGEIEVESPHGGKITLGFKELSPFDMKFSFPGRGIDKNGNLVVITEPIHDLGELSDKNRSLYKIIYDLPLE